MADIETRDTYVRIRVPLDSPIGPGQIYPRVETEDWPNPNPYLQYDAHGLWVVMDLDDGASVRKLVTLDRAREMVDFIERFVLREEDAS